MARFTERKGNFTKKFLDSIVLPKERADWWDTTVPGLLVRVSKTGSKVFYWMGRSGRKAIRVKICEYGDIPLDAVRDKARQFAIEAFNGAKPKPVTSLNAELSLHKLWTWWLHTHAKPHRKDWKRDQANYESKLIQLAVRKISTITTEEVQNLHIQLGESHGRAAANTTVKLLGMLYRTGKRILKIKVDDPTQGVKLFHQPSRERFLKAGELSAFIEAVKKQTPLMRDFIFLALYTGARRSAVAAMRWVDLDLEERVWRIRREDSKSKRPMTVVLSQPAIDILLKRKQENNSSEYVLPSRSASGHVTTPQFAIQSVLEESELSDIRFHDLRRTLGSWMAPNTSLTVIAKQLGQSSLSSAAIYARLDLTEVRAAVEKASLAIASKEIIPKKTENSLSTD